MSAMIHNGVSRANNPAIMRTRMAMIETRRTVSKGIWLDGFINQLISCPLMSTNTSDQSRSQFLAIVSAHIVKAHRLGM